jgi:hypothetical protein
MLLLNLHRTARTRAVQIPRAGPADPWRCYPVVGTVLAHQHWSQLDPEIRDAAFGNTGTVVSFRVGGQDVTVLAREFAPVFSAEDPMGLPRFAMYLRLLVDGEVSRPCSASSIGAPPVVPSEGRDR